MNLNPGLRTGLYNCPIFTNICNTSGQHAKYTWVQKCCASTLTFLISYKNVFENIHLNAPLQRRMQGARQEVIFGC